MKRRCWTAHERDRMLDMWNSPASTQDIADAFDTTPQGVVDALRTARRYGDPRAITRIERNALARQPPPASASLLCPEFGIESVTRFLPNRGVSVSTGGASFVPVSLPRLRCLEGTA